MMRAAEKTISFFWISLAIGVCIKSVGLRLGTFSDPGPGFLPFGTGAILGFLAITHLFLISFRQRTKEDPEFVWINVRWVEGLYVVVALFAYTLLLPIIGYLIDTFLLMLFLFTVTERRKLWVDLSYSVLVVALSYLVFAVWLMVQLPKGSLWD